MSTFEFAAPLWVWKGGTGTSQQRSVLLWGERGAKEGQQLGA